MSQKDFIEPFSDMEMEYIKKEKRYVLDASYFEEVTGRSLSAELEAAGFATPELASQYTLNRVSRLVYNNIYSYGRTKRQKEYLLACNPEMRPIIRDAMIERLLYMMESGDLSTKSGIVIEQGSKISTTDQIPSVVEEMILRPTGILHRGSYHFIPREDLDY